MIKIKWSAVLSYLTFSTINMFWRDHFEDLGIGERVKKVELENIGQEVVDWIHVAKNRDQRQEPVHTVLNIRVM
jgi:hypothetical protein